MGDDEAAGRRAPERGTPRAEDLTLPAAPPSPRPPARPRDALRSEVHLACISGPDIGAVVPLTEPMVLGRQGDVPLSTASASRRHARVSPLPPGHARGRHGQVAHGVGRRRWPRQGRGRRPPVARVEDLASANGTTVDNPGVLRRSRSVPSSHSMPSMPSALRPAHPVSPVPTVAPGPAPASTRSRPLPVPPAPTERPAPSVPPEPPAPSVPTVPTTTGSERVSLSRRECLRVGSRVRIGEDVFEVRERPDSLVWPEAPARRAPSPMSLAPVVMLVGFLLWRVWAMGGALPALLLAGTVVSVAVVVLGVRRSRRSRRWARWDAAHLALVLASLESTGASSPGPEFGAPTDPTAPRVPGPGAGWLWPGRPGTRGALCADLVPRDGAAGTPAVGLGPSEPTGAGTGAGGWASGPLRAGPARAASGRSLPAGGSGGTATPETVRRVGLVGPRALEAALWWCAQVAARTGGAVVSLPPTASFGTARIRGTGSDRSDDGSGEAQQSFVLGDGGTPVHVVDSDGCPHCERAAAESGGDGGGAGGAGGAPTPPGRHHEPASGETGGGAPPALHVGIAGDYRSLPPWCDRVVEDPDPPVSPLWWRQVARAVPADPGGVGSRGGLPSCVLLSELGQLLADPLVTDDAQVDEAAPPGSAHPATPTPTTGHTGLPALIGMGAGGPVTIDLVRDGPHALLAGTTGSGKSEALATWLLALAGKHSPDRLRLVLIDYKGGAALRPFAALPHTEEVLTDLDPSATERALTGLGALLVNRERELADVGVPDLARWELAHALGRAPAPPTRVLVVIDEFRILADSHPTTLEALVRLAAQGRSLGLHLIAATQRPAGALTPAMRANIEVRLALRCAEEADSLDVLGSTAAARLPRLPGRAVLRGSGVLQVAWVPDIDEEVTAVARTWAQGATVTGAISPTTSDPRGPVPVARARLWAPDLPEHCSWADIPRMQPSVPTPVPAAGSAVTPPPVLRPGHPSTPLPTVPPDVPPALPLALADRISGTSHGPLLWRSGGISVEGPAFRSGELEALALSLGTRIATGRALPLHACSHAHTRPAGCVTWIRPDDPGVVSMLLEGVLRHGPAVLVVTDVQSMTEGIDRALGPGRGRAWWGRILASADRAGVVLVVARPGDIGAASTGATPHLPHRLLLVGSSEEALRSGLPASAPTSRVPGRVLARGFDEGASGHLRCQVPLEPYPSAAAPPAPLPAHAAPPWCVRSAPDVDEHLPDWALGWAGPELLPLRVPRDLDWVVVAADPGPALHRLEALRGPSQRSAARAPGAVRGSRLPGAGPGTGSPTDPGTDPGPGPGPTHGPDPVPGVTVVHPDQWPTLRTLGARPIIALDPGEEVLRLLAASSRDCPPSLRAMEWGRHSGVLAHAGRVTRLVLPAH